MLFFNFIFIAHRLFYLELIYEIKPKRDYSDKAGNNSPLLFWFLLRTTRLLWDDVDK